MQIPPLERFRQETGTRYGSVWEAEPEGATFTLMLPDGEPVWEEGDWEGRPDEASHRMALAVVPEADALREEALAFLARIVNFDALRLGGEPFVIGIHCDAGTQNVVVELEWTEEVYCRFSVTFAWRMGHAQLPDHRTATGMAFWGR
jgi:hypothetical protein